MTEHREASPDLGRLIERLRANREFLDRRMNGNYKIGRRVLRRWGIDMGRAGDFLAALASDRVEARDLALAAEVGRERTAKEQADQAVLALQAENARFRDEFVKDREKAIRAEVRAEALEQTVRTLTEALKLQGHHNSVEGWCWCGYCVGIGQGHAADCLQIRSALSAVERSPKPERQI